MTGPSPAPLAEKADIVRGVTFSKADAVGEPRDGYSPVLRAGNIQGQLILDHGLVFVPESKISEKQRLRCGDIVMCTSSGSTEIVGKTAYSEKDWDGSFGAFCAVVRPKEGQCHPRYLFHYLQSPKFRDWTRNSSGAGIKNIRKSELDAVEIPFPNIDEQRRIARILDKAEAIRRKREQALELADEFLKSVFLEMFGDPLINSKSLPTKPLSDFGKIVTGNTPPRANPRNYGNHIEWIKSDNINTPEHLLTKSSEHLSKEGMELARTVPAGSILVICIAGSPSSIGKVAIADRDVALNQQINAITPNADVDQFFLYSQFLVGQRLIQSASTQSMKGMVSKGKFKEIEFLAPEPEEQQEFGRIFKKSLHNNNILREAHQNSHNLFASLSQRAFQGKL
ncbi:restriction endonuclease subunit S [bacterium]|nr:restriction endonuclease subunit S [bacterium]